MGAGVGVLEVTAPPSGGMTAPLEGPMSPTGRADSVSGACEAWLVAWRMNDAAHQAWTARVMWVFAGHATGSFRDRPTTGPHRYRQSGSG